MGISKVPVAGWIQILIFCFQLETSQDQLSDEFKSRQPGDFGFKVLTSSDPEEKQKKLASEIANGRLAMMAIVGMMVQDGLTGSAWGDWSLYTDSPLRAFENELGAQPPLGYWDPAGFVADGDEENFWRYRSAEIKHGRIAMLATVGYMTPEITGKMNLLLSWSARLKMTDVPNGLAAISKVPAAGWIQILVFCFQVETAQDRLSDEFKSRQPGDFGFKVLQSYDPEEKQKKLASEIANGRLAMMAIVGMM